MKTIPLPSGEAHIRFRVTLADATIAVRLDWLERADFYTVRLSVGGEVIAAGRGLHPEVNVLEGLGMGVLKIEGEAPTPSNLGITNKLRYIAP